jgi:hypothetical protein
MRGLMNSNYSCYFSVHYKLKSQFELGNLMVSITGEQLLLIATYKVKNEGKKHF